jgi:hypothetical protein
MERESQMPDNISLDLLIDLLGILLKKSTAAIKLGNF